MAKLVRARRVSATKPTADWSEALDEYIMTRKADGLRSSTLKGQRAIISLLFRRYPEAWGNPKAGVLKFLSEDVKPATYNIRVAYLKTFFDWCHKQGYVSENPMLGFKKQRAGHRIVNIEADVISRLLELPDRRTFAGLRDRALLLATLDTGIRPGEATRLLIEDVNLSAAEIYVRSEVSKTKVQRTLPISPSTAKAIRELISARPESWGTDVPVFSSENGTRLSIFSWEDRLKKYSRRLGVQIRPYDLRHAFALHFLRNGGHALALQRVMGHSDLSMTKRYVALTDGDIRQQHAAASPVGRLLPQRTRVRKLR